MSIVIVATLKPQPDLREAMIADLEAAIAQVQAEDEGCELYSLNVGEDRLVMIEKWASMDAIKAHGQSAGLAAFTAATDGKLTEPMDVQFLTPHPVGTTEQGVL